MLTMMLLMIFIISSCKDKIICAEVKKAEIKPIAWCDISFSPKPRCRCRCLNLGYGRKLADNLCNEGGNIFKSGNYPIKDCEGIAGPSHRDWAVEVKPKFLRLNAIKQTYCK